MSWLVGRIKCLLSVHEWTRDRAEEFEEDGYTRVYQDEQNERINACSLVDCCSICGKERRTNSSVDSAKRLGYTLEWEGEEDRKKSQN